MKQLFLLLLFFICTYSNAQNNWQQKVDAEVWVEANQHTDFEFFVLLKDQANTNTKHLNTKEAKAHYVFNVLKNKAAETQGELLNIIQQYSASYKSYFIVNGIWVKGNANLMEALAKREEVKTIAPNPHIQNDLPRAEPEYARTTQAITWGVNMIRATQLWGYNIKGNGIVVGGQDTGYEWFHPAIKNQYRGDSLNHNYHWHDAIHGQISSDTFNKCGYDVTHPCDDQTHGTHTMGTMVGDDGAGEQIGVAPEARWIGCRNMENGWGAPSTYIECFEWFLAPTDTNNQNPDPNMAPHVIANSWSCPPAEGCNTSNFSIMQTAVENLKNSGVFVAVSAGNSGSAGCNSIDAPAAIFEASFSVGASDILDTLANFSSRGSVAVDNSFRLKPNVVAPGVGVRSCIPNGGYASYSGTSMAGPHVAGAVALIISAATYLAGNVDSIESLLQITADTIYTYRDDTCGNTPQTVFPNNMVGYGRINLYKVMKIIRPDLTDNLALLPTEEMQIFPNPFSIKVQIKTARYVGNAKVLITNAIGQDIRRFDTYFTNNLELDLKDIPNGVYLIMIENEQFKMVGKVVKQGGM